MIVASPRPRPALTARSANGILPVVVGPADMALTECCYRWGRALWGDRPVCRRVIVTVERDARLAPEPPAPVGLWVCFDEGIVPALRVELEWLRDADDELRAVLVEALEPVTILWDEPRGRRRVVGRLDAPRTRARLPLQETSFPVRIPADADGGGEEAMGGRARTPGLSVDAMTESGSGQARLCVRCGAPAVYHYPGAGDDLCSECACYLAGQYHAEATRERCALRGAIAGLLASGLTREHIMATVDAELEGKDRPTGPDIAHRDDPRPWVAYLMAPITPAE